MRSFGRVHVLRSAITTIVVITAAILAFIPAHSYFSYAATTPKVVLKNHVQEIHNIPSEPTNSAPTDWPEFHGDVARDSNQPTNIAFNKVNATTLTTVPGPGFTTLGSIESSPAIYQGVLYAVAGTLVTSGTTTSDVSTIYAIDASSGQILWQSIVPTCNTGTNQEWIASSPAVTTGMVNGNATTEVFIGWGAPKSGRGLGCVFNFDGSTGNLIWFFPIHAEVDSSPAIMTTNTGTIIVIGDGKNYVRGFSVNYTGPLNSLGTPLWAYNTRTDVAPPGYSQYCQPAPQLCGDSVWSSPAEGTVMVNGVIHHYAYFGLGAGTPGGVGRIDAIDLDSIVNGSPAAVWQTWDPQPQNDNDISGISVLTDSNGMALRVFASVTTGHLYGVDAVTGALYFTFDVATQLGIGSEIHSNAAIATVNGTTELVFASGCFATVGGSCQNSALHGYIWGIDALSTNPNGTLLWKSMNFGSDIVSSPVIVNQDNNAVIFALGPWKKGTAKRGDLLALDPTNGSLVADYSVFNRAYGAISSPAVYGNRIYLGEGYTSYQNSHPNVGGLAVFQCSGC